MCITRHSNKGNSLKIFKHVLTRQPATFSSDTSTFPRYNPKEKEKEERRRRRDKGPVHLTPESFFKAK